MSINEIFNKVGAESKILQNEQKEKEKILEYNSHIYEEINRKIGREFIQALPKFFLENHVEPNYTYNYKICFFAPDRGWILEKHDDGDCGYYKYIVTTKSIYYISPDYDELRRMVTVDQLIDGLIMFRNGIDQKYLSSQIRTETEITNIIERNIETSLKNIINGKDNIYR